jgi:hypothetical protein
MLEPSEGYLDQVMNPDKPKNDQQEVLSDLHQKEGKKELTVSQETLLRNECRKLEKELGIETEAERILEATLFIDKPFLDLSLLRGDKHPEEIFGIEAWKGWVSARVEARKLKKLSVGDVERLHLLLTEHMGESVHKYREKTVYGGDYTAHRPRVFTEEEKKAIEDNPLLTVRMTNEAEKLGYIVYPTKDDENNFEKTCKDLSELNKPIIWEKLDNRMIVKALLHNAIKEANTSKSLESAALLQQRVVSIHPFTDGNGRLSRLLMYWALEKARRSPAILERQDEDLFFGKDEWVDHVKIGQQKYKLLKEEIQNNRKESPVVAFIGLSKKAFFDVVYRKQFPPQKEGRPLFHGKVREYLNDFERVHKIFSKWAEIKHSFGWKDVQEDIEVLGLISPDYIASWGDTKPDKQKEIREKYFYQNREIYRGGVCLDIERPEDLLNLFLGPTGLTSEYRNSFREKVSPLSIRRLAKEPYKKELSTFNNMVLHDVQIQSGEKFNFRRGTFGDTLLRLGEDRLTVKSARVLDKNTFLWGVKEGKCVEELANIHSRGDELLQISPFVSASIKFNAAEYFRDYLEDSKLVGVPKERIKRLIISSLLPRQGFIYRGAEKNNTILEDYRTSLRSEKELLVVGAIDPNSVRTVEMFDNSGTKILAVAHRDMNGAITLVDTVNKNRTTYFFDDLGYLKEVSKNVVSDEDINKIVGRLQSDQRKESPQDKLGHWASY